MDTFCLCKGCSTAWHEKGMLVLGHERSEEWGMKHLPAWLKSITEDLPVTFVDAEEPFTYIV